MPFGIRRFLLILQMPTAFAHLVTVRETVISIPPLRQAPDRYGALQKP